METAHLSKRRQSLLASAHALGVEQPERFRSHELEALLASLPVPAQETPPAVPSSDTMVRTRDPAEPAPRRAFAVPVEPYVEDPFFLEPVPTPPPLLRRDEIWLLAVEPEWLMATWDTAEDTALRAAAGEQPVLRVQSPDMPGVLDVDVDLRASNWWLRSPRDRVQVLVLLGFGRGGAFQPVARSAVVTIPPRGPAPPKTSWRVNVPYDFDRRGIPQRAAEHWLRGEVPPGSLLPAEVSAGPSALDTVERLRALPPHELRTILADTGPTDHDASTWVEAERTDAEWLEMWFTHVSTGASSAEFARGDGGGANHHFRVPHALEGLLPPVPWKVPPSSGRIPARASMPVAPRQRRRP
jgi:hypothetical protein